MATTTIDYQTLQQLLAWIWNTMLGQTIDEVSTAWQTDLQPAAAASTGSLTAAVQITGGWNGTVLFLPSYAFGQHAAAHMLDMPLEELTQADIQDAVAELVNIIGGGVKSIMPGPSALSLPMVTFGPQFSQRIRGAELVLQFDFCSVGEALRLRLFEGLPC